jgi:hypothetical protein
MVPHTNLYYQVTRKVTLTFKLQRSSVINTSRKFNLLVSFRCLKALTRTTVAWCADYLTHTVTSFTLHPHHHYALVKSHKTSTVTAATFLRFGTWFGLATMTGATVAFTTVLDCLDCKNYTFDVPLTD